MTRKTSAYARKRQRCGLPADPSVMWSADYLKPLITLTGSRPFEDSMNVKDANRIMLNARMALQRLTDRRTLPADTDDHDLVAHCIGIAQIRTLDIGGPGAGEVMEQLNAGAQALLRARERHERTGEWGLDGPAIQELRAALEIYEAILKASSPVQMERAQSIRLEQVKKLQLEAI